MANLLPYLFDSWARRAEWPPLAREEFRLVEDEIHVGPEGEGSRMAELLEILTASFSWAVEPRPFGEWLGGQRGVPLLGREETERFIERVEHVDEPPSAPRWYELMRLGDGNYILIPNDDAGELRLDVLMPVVTSSRSVQIHWANIARSIGATPGPGFGYGWIEQARCVLQAERDDPELPWHGVCQTIVCDHGCTPLTLFDADSGDYILTGCRCWG